MLGFYLCKNREAPGGCRGWVEGSGEVYGLEIGNNCNANSDMIAFLRHMPEVLELLKLYESNGSSLSALLLHSIKETETKIETDLREKGRTSG